MELNIEYLPLQALKPYEKNARKHTVDDLSTIKASIKQFGMNDPIGVWGKKNIIVEGHGRYMACKELGFDKIPVLHLDHLSDEQRRAYALAHNKTAEMSEWDIDLLDFELAGITEIDMSDFGFDVDIIGELSDDEEYEQRKSDFEERMRSGELSEDDEEYQEFLQKFEAKKTTDDCYTPPLVYTAVEQWVEKEYGLSKANFVRPFCPGGDYQRFNYEKTDIVVDNPPFSIISEICRYYSEHGIKFFMFAPHLTICCIRAARKVICGVNVIYENTANVNTSFVTNLEKSEIRSAPTLYAAIKQAVDDTLKEQKKELPKYEYPFEVITSSMLAPYSRLGIDFRVLPEECMLIPELDAQKVCGKGIFGSGYLISRKKAAEREKAEREKAKREKAERWELSKRETEIIDNLG